MSGINVAYEFAGGGEELTYFENEKDPKNFANIIATEIVNEIFENAIDIVTQVNKTGNNWKDIKESHNGTSSSNLPIVCELKNLKNVQNEIKPDIVGDNIENPDNTKYVNTTTQSSSRIEEEMKKLLTEVLSPIRHIKTGVGDQLEDETSQLSTTETIISDIPKSIGKKSRVTDLIKNSPQIINEYLSMDEDSKQNQEKWEESEERLLQVIELDCVKLNDEPFRISKSMLPENVILQDDDEEDELIQIPKDDIMDVIDLSSAAFKEEERQLFVQEEHNCGAKGDEDAKDSCSSCFVNKVEQQSSPIEEKVLRNRKPNDLNIPTTKKKKWNFGAKILGLFRKGHKQKN